MHYADSLRRDGVAWMHSICITSSKVTAPQDAHGRLVLQGYLGSNTLEFSSKIFVSRL